jgi:hypothetical protein
MKKFVVLALCLGSTLTACKEDVPTSVGNHPSAESARAWVATEPVQCLTNPWEADWVQDHPGETYPRDLNSWPRRLTDEEVAIITDYYAELGVTVYGADTREKARTICAACNCEEGFTLFLLVGESDVETMIGLGYRRAAPKP